MSCRATSQFLSPFAFLIKTQKIYILLIFQNEVEQRVYRTQIKIPICRNWDFNLCPLFIFTEHCFGIHLYRQVLCLLSHTSGAGPKLEALRALQQQIGLRHPLCRLPPATQGSWLPSGKSLSRDEGYLWQIFQRQCLF